MILTQPSFRGIIGVAREGITPSGIDARGWGAAWHDVAEGVHHPRALAWDNKPIPPDDIGAMREVVEVNRTPCLFLQGASGELASAEPYSGDVAPADAHGRRPGHAVRAVLGAMLPPETALASAGVVESCAPLAIWKRSGAASGCGGEDRQASRCCVA